ncbi:MAG: periplasmic sensor signal transduction histidine kinase, partial [Acidimicrobiales bacterium]|nr:periplasmic sensor signal transduction histidine kinase [Acidimicrobiales bacterium]
MFDNLTIRSKLISLLAGPLAIIVVLAGLGARDRRDTAASGQRAERILLLSRANSDAMHALQMENLFGSGYIASGRTQWKPQLDQARSKTDAAVAQVSSSFDAVAKDLPDSVQISARLGLQAMSRLGAQRQAVDQIYAWDQEVAALTAMQNTFLTVNGLLADEIKDTQLAVQMRTIGALNEFKSSVAVQGALLSGASGTSGLAGTNGFTAIKDAQDALTLKQALFRSLADGVGKGNLRDAMATPAAARLDAASTDILKAGPTAPVLLSTSDVVIWTSSVLGRLHDVELRIDVDLLNSAAAQAATSQKAANLYLSAAGLGILLAAAASVVFGRRITQPLQRLTRAAEQLSDDQMPRLVEALRNPAEEDVAHLVSSMTPIAVSSNDELGALASAFNKVQQVAGDVATEQAALLRKGIGEMFVNLARRNQTLLDRQIEFIDELESQEEDPDQLENLFKLDHLATRMRRNAESLLVLAGAEPARKRGRPAPLADVVRAALGEVEEFARIDLLSFDEVAVASNAAMDVAHLLSELMENATNFSPPETRVEVVGHRTKADGYVLSVSDKGIGMSTTQLTDFNQLLAHPPLVGLALTRSLGFIVIGRLAARFGITVRLMPSASGGVTAVVSLPPGLITDSLPVTSAALMPPSRPALAPTASGAPDAPSLVRPLELTPYDAPVPDSYAGAVPEGAAFDAGLASLIDAPDGSASSGAPLAGLAGASAPPATAPTSPLPPRHARRDADTTRPEPAPTARSSGPAPSTGATGGKTASGLPARRRESAAAAPSSTSSITHEPMGSRTTPQRGAGPATSLPVHPASGEPAMPPAARVGGTDLPSRPSPAPAGTPRLDGPAPRIDGAPPL